MFNITSVWEYFSLSIFQFEFLTSFLNIIDLLGILPFFISMFLNLLSSHSLDYIAKAAQIFRILRILRIFKLSRHILGLKTLGTTLRNSHRWRLKKVNMNLGISFNFQRVTPAGDDSNHGNAHFRWTCLCTGERWTRHNVLYSSSDFVLGYHNYD